MIFVNQEIVDPKAARVQALTDLDIVTDRAVIQVKSGRTRGLSAQIDKSRLVTGKTVIAYAPQMDDVTFEKYQRGGYRVFRKLSDLLAFLGGHRA